MGKSKWTQHAIKALVEKRGYELIKINDYKGVNSRITVKCSNSHKPYEVGFNGFKNGSNCQECKNEKMRGRFAFSEEEVAITLANDGYTLVSNYVNANTLIKVVCPNNHEFETTLGNFKSGHRCAKCKNCAKLTNDMVKEILNKEGYRLLSEYTGSNDHLLVECPKGHVYKTRYSRFQQKVGCSLCNESKGEKEIAKVLNELGIAYISQYRFDDLRGVRNGLLSYDFYIRDYNLLIEFQGAYHDGTSNRQTEEELQRQKEHDKRKLQYASTNGYKLLEIWYHDIKKIEDIIKNELGL